MTIVSSGTISINSLVGEYGGSVPHSMNEYYRGGSLVANHSNNGNVPTSGQIQLDDFYGANNTSPAPTVYNYSMTSGGSGLANYIGFDVGGGTTAVGSLSNNPQSTAFSNGFNPTIYLWASLSSIGKSGNAINDVYLRVANHVSNTGFTSITMPSNLCSSGNAETLNRTAATHGQSTAGRVETVWSWSTTFALVTGQTGTVSMTQ